MPVCPYCSTTLESDARFCGVCGRPVDNPPPAPEAAPHPPAAAVAAVKVNPVAATPAALASTVVAPAPAVPIAAATPPSGRVRAALQDDPLIGQTLNNRYLVDGKIGEGGFGAVYRGKQLATGREVALKILHAHNLNDQTIVARFRREAEACSKLRDPHTVTTYDFDQTSNGTLYLAMELLHGRSLHQLQKTEGTLPSARVLNIIDQVAQSLGEAHANGIVHRDMKPENVIVETRGEQDYVKVLDFGIAKMMSGDKEVQALTAIGQTLGTLEFMSPEQLRGLKLDGRSDIYALGMMAYEMLTGALPFKGAKTPIEIINFHMKDMPRPPSAMRPDLEISEAADDVILKMVAKSRDDRHADAAALREHIAEAQRGGGRRPGLLAALRRAIGWSR
jgi:serine/threonine protein kinase